ncbi:MAG: diguanylate cyclase domain-containing protein [bacterium]
MPSDTIFLDRLLDILQDGIVITDKENQIKFLSKTASKLLFPGEESALEKNILESPRFQKNNLFKEEIFAHLRSGVTPSYNFIDSDESVPEKIEFTFWPVFNEQERFQGLIITAYDLSQLPAEQNKYGNNQKDPYTRLKKSASFYRSLKDYVSRFQQDNTLQLTLLVFELDCFPEISSAQSPRETQNQIKEIVDTCIATIRTEDMMFQLGVGRFSIILTRTSTYNAMLVADRIRKEVQEASQFTASMGSVALRDSISAEEMIELALSRMEKAKRSGGNCCY